jgi:DNA-binding transcriptional ArsR family regulator
MVTHAKRALPAVVSGRKVKDTRKGLPAAAALDEAAEVFKLLASPVRLAIMHALAHHELTVGDLARAIELSLSVASHQLALLRRMHLVASRDEGRLTYYRATDALVGHLIHDCLTHVGERLGIAPHHHRHGVSGTSRKKLRPAPDQRGQVRP